MDSSKTRPALKGGTMPLSKITRNRQVTIPKEIFEAFNLKQGDYVEFSKDGTQIIIRPQTIVDRDEAKRRLFELVDSIQERNRDVDPEVVEREVAKAIQESRKAKKS